jgi:hypothetical protein
MLWDTLDLGTIIKSSLCHTTRKILLLVTCYIEHFHFKNKQIKHLTFSISSHAPKSRKKYDFQRTCSRFAAPKTVGITSFKILINQFL